MGISFSHGLQQGPVTDTFKRIVHEWNIAHADNPAAQVQIKEYTVFDQPAKEALATGEGTFVLAPEYMTGTMMTAAGEKKVIPVKELLDSDVLDRIAGIVKRTFGDAEGNLFSLPFNPACGVLFVNADLVKEMPKTMEELEAISLRVMKEGKAEGGFTCAWPAAYLVEVPAAQQDIPLVTPQNGKLGFGQYRLGEEWLFNHLLDIRRMHREGVFVYAGQTNDAKKPFIQKKVAFFMQGSTHYPILQKEADFPITACSLPPLLRGSDTKHAFPLGGASVWVLDNETTRAMIGNVKEFLAYLASEEVQEMWHKETGYVPVRTDLPQKLADFYKDHPVHRAVVEQTIEAKLGEYSFGIGMPNYAAARKELFNLIEQILDPSVTDEDVMTLLKAFDAKYSLEKP